MIRIVIDTDILIDHLRGMEKAKEYLREIEEVEVTSKLVTRNVKHYEMIAELEIEKPY